jgi:diaminohydroxyphosphoribosylaminopyrimidine deaminase/5-amino-6-(5-phosphoribosylamino)uracil reductase
MVAKLRKQGVQILGFASKNGQIPLRRLLSKLSKKNIGSILVEGGSDVSGAFVAAGLVDEISTYVAPTVHGGNISVFKVDRKLAVHQANRQLERVQTMKIGPDVLISYFYH